MKAAAVLAGLAATCALIIKGDSGLESVRARAVKLLTSYIPCGPDDARFNEITKDYGGKGTTCGYVTPWLLWRLGSRSDRLINRSEPAEGLTYRPGMNISDIRWQPEFCLYDGKALPRPGDTFFVSDGPSDTEHVGLLLEIKSDGAWVCAEAGQRDDAGRQCARIVDRRLIGGRLARVDGKGTPRILVGWLDLDAAMSAAA
jgi:hypothetical protein